MECSRTWCRTLSKDSTLISWSRSAHHPNMASSVILQRVETQPLSSSSASLLNPLETVRIFLNLGWPTTKKIWIWDVRNSPIIHPITPRSRTRTRIRIVSLLTTHTTLKAGQSSRQVWDLAQAKIGCWVSYLRKWARPQLAVISRSNFGYSAARLTSDST
jgi:hypothetical protein